LAQKVTIVRDRAFWLFLLIAFFVRAQTYGNPVIEFDEQFYLLMGDRMLHGALPYVDIWDRKPIGLFLLFAAFRWVGGLFGGDGVLSYQLAATLCVALTARCISAIATRLSAPPFGAYCAGAGYIIWLNLLQGEGGQASVFYTLPMTAAGWLILGICQNSQQTKHGIGGTGFAAMALIGIAIQIKYTVVFEGAVMGLWLLFAARQRGALWTSVAAMGCGWAFVALVPTVAAMAYFAGRGQLDAFLFANFWSGFARAPLPVGASARHLLSDIAIISLLIVAAIKGLEALRPTATSYCFVLSWIASATFAILIFGTFSPHYFIPLLPPLLMAAAPFFSANRRFGIASIITALISGQVLVGYLIWSKGGRAQAQAMAEAIGPVPHCLYVHDGYPILYLLTQSCLPSRFVFPGHLNTATEANALGIDTVAEVKNILARMPDAIVTDRPAFSQGNPATQKLVESALSQHYRLVLKLRTGKARYRLVYRRRSPPMR
jgi:hypothetical protein